MLNYNNYTFSNFEFTVILPLKSLLYFIYVISVKTPITNKWNEIIYYLNNQALKISIQKVSNIYTPSMSESINIKKRTLKIHRKEADQEMKDNDEDDLLLESGITDFWVLNSSYKQLITTTEMKNMNNNELLTAIQMNFKNFNDFNINDELHKIKVSYNESDLYSAKTDGRDIETQVIFMWRFSIIE